MTDLNFKFEKFLVDYIRSNSIKILCGAQTNTTKGLTISTGEIFINLSSPYWKVLDENSLISEISKTITHEYIHSLLYDNRFPQKGEECICQILSNQV